MRHQRYADYRIPGTFLGQWRLRWRAWRIRARQEVPNGQDYTGWRARIVKLPTSGARPGVGTEGVVIECHGEGARRKHYIEFPGATWAMPLPSRCIELIPPAGSI